ncbi:MAG: exodeoxyribonuclease VII small subunit, partial [Gemmataceae bacterium]
MPAPDELDFEQALQELERLLRQLENGQTTLEESLLHYERGVQLVRICQSQLQQAEHKIQQLTGLDENG